MKNKTTIVFDLDDTLYNEIDYVKSGFSYIENFVFEHYKTQLTKNRLFELYSEGTDPLAFLCGELKLTDLNKENFLWLYRLHRPDINLSSDALNVIKQTEKKYQVCILTDGRSVTQRLKINALGLDRFDLFISDEWNGAAKPDPTRFKAIMDKYNSEKYIYIGDNVKKDFIAPNELNWKSICLLSNGQNIHQQDFNDLSENQKPEISINNILEVLEII